MEAKLDRVGPHRMPRRRYEQVKPYPPHDDMRVGIKVSWYTYADKAQAHEASKIAQHNADILAAQGYDFGYQAPGAVTTLPDGRFEVTIP